MGPTTPRPDAVRWTALILVGLGLLGGATGLAMGAFGVLATLFDPTLGGDTSLSFAVGAGAMAGSMIGLGLPLLAAQAVWDGRPSARVLGGLVGGATLLTPLLPVGLGVLWTLWGGGAAARWLEEEAQLRRERRGLPAG